MQRIMIAALLAALAVAAAGAEEPRERAQDAVRVERADLALRELSSLLESREGSALGEVRIRDVRDLLAEASVRMQELQFLGEVRQSSLMMPGVGHLKAGDNGRGAAYLAANVVLTAGTLVGAYFLLPAEVRFDEVSYFTDSYQEIETAWKGQSLVDMLPSIGALAGGFAVRGLLGYFAAESAGHVAAARIRAGEIRFEPYAAAERLGLRATWRR